MMSFRVVEEHDEHHDEGEHRRGSAGKRETHDAVALARHASRSNGEWRAFLDSGRNPRFFVLHLGHLRRRHRRQRTPSWLEKQIKPLQRWCAGRRLRRPASQRRRFAGRIAARQRASTPLPRFMPHRVDGSLRDVPYAPQSSAEADAAHDRAISAAEGVGVPQDWTAALGHLRRSAQLGSRLAQAELAALSRRWALAHALLSGQAPSEELSSSLLAPIDLADWLKAPHRLHISPSPRLTVIKTIAEPEMCDWLIARARPRLAPAKIYDSKANEQRGAGERTNSDCLFRRPDSDLILAILRARMAAAAETPVHAMENTHVLHYSVGQEFRPHFDTPVDAAASGIRQRPLTVLVSLNDDYEGGETEFPATGGRWKGRKGNALLFWNVQPDGTLDRCSLHAGLPVTRGEKWLLSQWIGRSARAE
jgi:predicted 2-oxoglutarate/Fe(II)-dependent dioxygenase YbiX